jgi:hypothetical protein
MAGMNGKLIKALIVMGLQLLAVFAENAFSKPPNEEEEGT